MRGRFGTFRRGNRSDCHSGQEQCLRWYLSPSDLLLLGRQVVILLYGSETPKEVQLAEGPDPCGHRPGCHLKVCMCPLKD